MGSLAAGHIVLVRFPFSDLSAVKLRPAIVLASASKDDLILCQITSNPYEDSRAIEIPTDGMSSGLLDRRSYVRPGKLFTAHRSLVAKSIGRARDQLHEQVLEAVVVLLRSS